ncbi:hypothetical protein, partial [Yersinia ruckeri]|uniref:hypothetical protein n=1 Tax=Yersinia ruckeri TaxID=29486 RepID=UPI0028F44A4F
LIGRERCGLSRFNGTPVATPVPRSHYSPPRSVASGIYPTRQLPAVLSTASLPVSATSGTLGAG